MSNEVEPYTENEIVLEEKTDQNIEKDLQEVRTNLKTMLNNGTDVLNHLKDNALQSDDGDYFDLFTKLLKTLSDVNGKFMENINERRKEGEGSTDMDKGAKTVTNNTLVVAEGSTQDIVNDIINNRKK